MRRKFFEAQPFAPACEEVLELIGEVYAIEAELPGWAASTGEVRRAALAHRLAVRQQYSTPVVERIRQWALAQRAAPGSAFRKALEYMLKLWDGLTVFLRIPVVPLDNNHVERQMRDMVVGRNNLRRGRIPSGASGRRPGAVPRQAAGPQPRRVRRPGRRLRLEIFGAGEPTVDWCARSRASV
ncbi:transposase [Pyxidicoccus parkwayensis]|uniref:Transposase n=1 Tax=Pyxidicoccus parkwayensis TaxID=2813578 RepID=A0ABX7NVL4_9BACT|nr:transposase [Pyxidicoccus parkwaysis]QSQ22743.1 transposase [Pyxidicoccus parkwaysis]